MVQPRAVMNITYRRFELDYDCYYNRGKKKIFTQKQFFNTRPE